MQLQATVLCYRLGTYVAKTILKGGGRENAVPKRRRDWAIQVFIQCVCMNLDAETPLG